MHLFLSLLSSDVYPLFITLKCVSLTCLHQTFAALNLSLFNVATNISILLVKEILKNLGEGQVVLLKVFSKKKKNK